MTAHEPLPYLFSRSRLDPKYCLYTNDRDRKRGETAYLYTVNDASPYKRGKLRHFFHSYNK